MAWLGLLELIVWVVFVVWFFERFSLRIMDWLVDGILERDSEQ